MRWISALSSLQTSINFKRYSLRRFIILSSLYSTRSAKTNDYLEDIMDCIFSNTISESDYVELSSLCSIASGKRPPSKTDVMNRDNNIPLYGASKIMGWCNGYLYDEPILITGRVGTHGIVQKSFGKSWPSDNTLVIKTNNYGYVYECLKNIDFSVLNCGSTQPLITQSALGNVQVPVISDTELKRFNQRIESLITIQNRLIEENTALSMIRDLLLPKLMSGEIDVSNLDLSS